MIELKPIKGFNSFSLVFKAGKKFYDGELLSVFVKYESDSETALISNCSDELTFYYGVTAGKKFNKKAVVRNRVRRLLRESIRKIFSERYVMLEHPPFKYAVFSWRNAPKHPSLISLNDVFPSVEKVFNSADFYFKQNPKVSR